MVSAAEALRAGPGDTRPRQLAHTPVHTAFSAVAPQHPRRTPSRSPDEKSELTYAELDERSARMAPRPFRARRALRASSWPSGWSAAPEFVVVLLAHPQGGRGLRALVDPRYPADRIRYTVQDCAARLLLGEPDALPRLPGVRVLAPESVLDAADGAAGDPAAAQAPIVPAQAPAYVIYTSGSTGRPKGVLVPHRNVSALVAGTRGGFGLGPGEVWSFFHSTAFDFSVWEIWGCLLTGGRLVVVPSWAARDTELFYDLVARERVTVLSQTPSAFAHFVASDTRRAADLAVRLVVLGGEALATRDPRARGSPATAPPSARCRTCSVHHRDHRPRHRPRDHSARRGGGRPPRRQAAARLVGLRPGRARPGAPRPARAEEIWVGGAGAGDRLPLNRPGLTAERFVADELSRRQRLYRSGDLPAGSAPTARSTILAAPTVPGQDPRPPDRARRDPRRPAHPSSRRLQAAVVLRLAVEDDRDTARLDAYYVPVNGVPAPTRTELADHLALSLPEYMLPATLTRLDAIAPHRQQEKPISPRCPPRHPPARAAACSPAKSATVSTRRRPEKTPAPATP